MTKLTNVITNRFPACFAVVLLVQLLIGSCFVSKVPLWMPSDERAHYRYIMDVSKTHRLPIIGLNGASYESHQPPLYYALAASLDATVASFGFDIPARGRVARYFGLLIFLASTVVFAKVLQQAFSQQEEKFFVLTCLAAYAWSPSMLAICSSVTNDSLSYFLTLTIVMLLSKALFKPRSKKWAIALGTVSALGLLTKITFFPTSMLAAACLLDLKTIHKNPGKNLSNLVVFLITNLVLFGAWLLRNYSVYHALTGYAEVHGTGQIVRNTPLSSPSELYSAAAAFCAYHFLPSEFWLNQFTVPPILKVTLTILVALTLLKSIEVIIASVKRSEITPFIVAGSMLYALDVTVWLCLVIFVEGFAIRNFFGCYFAAISLLMLKMTDKKNPILTRSLQLALPIFMLGLDLWLIFFKMESLTAGNLRP